MRLFNVFIEWACNVPIKQEQIALIFFVLCHSLKSCVTALMTSLVLTEKPFVYNTNGLGNTSDLTTGSQPEKLGLKNKWDFPAVLSLSPSFSSTLSLRAFSLARQPLAGRAHFKTVPSAPWIRSQLARIRHLDFSC